MKHTSKPWKVHRVTFPGDRPNEIHILGPDNVSLAILYETYGPNVETNAQLIAAAPELLDLLKSCKVWLDGEDSGDSFDLYQRVVKAIAKTVK